MNKRDLILAVGQQSSGSTLISHAFLNHPELNGILDMASDKIELNFSRVKTDKVWVKMTTIAFTWSEVAAVYQLLGFNVHPLMIVRNPYDVWASLQHKWYGLNSTTAEDPPLVIRFMRFLKEWQLFRKNGWPIIQFENYIEDREHALKFACDQLPISWDESLISPPTSTENVAYVSESNASFSSNLANGVDNQLARKVGTLSADVHDWLLRYFKEFNEQYGYVNRHTVESNSALIPEPFDSRRFLGFGPAVAKRLVSGKLAALGNICGEKIAQNKEIVVFGASEFGEYLANCLLRQGVNITGFADSFVELGTKIGEWEVKPLSRFDIANCYFVVASFNHANQIKEMLTIQLDVPEQDVFMFEGA